MTAIIKREVIFEQVLRLVTLLKRKQFSALYNFVDELWQLNIGEPIDNRTPFAWIPLYNTDSLMEEWRKNWMTSSRIKRCTVFEEPYYIQKIPQCRKDPIPAHLPDTIILYDMNIIDHLQTIKTRTNTETILRYLSLF